ncbi:ABC transporter substrate-binding protein [soil metagenome]
MAAQPELLSIGEVAEQAGLAASALRFYERKGLVPPPTRVGGRRHYDRRVLGRLAIIGAAKRAGFTLAEVRELLEGFESPVLASERWRLLARRKLPEIEALIDGAHTMKRLLEEGLVCSCLRLSEDTLFAGAERFRSAPSPFTSTRGPGLVHVNFLFDTLLWKDATGGFLPWLAEAWRHSADGTEWRFTLRDGIRWHDGRPLTAHDVAFTVDYLTRGPGRDDRLIQGYGLDAVAAAVALGPSEVRIDLHRPFAPFEEWVAGRLLVLPEHIWADVTDPAAVTDRRAVMGSGPYLLDIFDAVTGTYSYTANPGYFLGVPYVRRIEFAAEPDAVGALRRADIDAVSAGGEGAVTGLAVTTGDDRAYDTITAPGEWVRALHLNLAEGHPFDDRRFRQAVAFAIDRVELVDRLLDGRGQPASMGGLAPSHPCTPHDLPRYGCDRARAGALLDAAGLRDLDGDGWRELPGGRRFCIELQTSPGASAAAAELVSRHLGTVGIEIRVAVMELAAAEAASAAGRYQMALVGYGGLGGDADLLRLRLSSRTGSRTWASVHGWDNPRFEELAAEQVVTLDPTWRRRLIEEMQRVVADDVAMIPLYVPSRAILHDPQVFDAWYFTPGGVAGAYPGPFNKHAFITGRREGFESAPGTRAEDHFDLPWHGCPARSSIPG